MSSIDGLRGEKRLTEGPLQIQPRRRVRRPFPVWLGWLMLAGILAGLVLATWWLRDLRGGL